ncbi:EAL domain-containing protein [Clostridium baratii]
MSKIKNLDKYLVYQPKVDLNTLEIVGLEALIRFLDPRSKNILDTEEVIDSITCIDEMIGLTNEVFDRVILDLEKLDNLNSKVNVSINMSSKELCNINVDRFLQKKLCNCKKYMERLEIEITEKHEIKDREIMKERISLIKNLGLNIAIDDLGSGFNQSDMLKDYNVDLVKVDKSMVINFNSKKDELNYIVDTCNEKNIKLLIEGVESKEDFKKFLDLGFQFGQGYYFYRPMKLEEILEKTNLLKGYVN